MAPTAPRGEPERRFLKAFDDYSDALFRHSSIRISDRERAIELVHDVFTKAWSYVREGNEVESYRPFLYKILNNLIIDEYRKRREESLDALLAQEGGGEHAFPDLHAGSLQNTIDVLDGKRAIDAIGSLPDVYREVLVLRFVDGLGPKEISALIEENENIVSVRLHRGVKMLRDRLGYDTTTHD